MTCKETLRQVTERTSVANMIQKITQLKIILWTVLCWSFFELHVKVAPSHHCRLPDGEDQGGDGQPRQGHHGEGLRPFSNQAEAEVEGNGDFFTRMVHDFH